MPESRLRRLLRDDRLWVALVLLAALALRLILLGQLAEGPYGDYLGLDERYYHTQGLAVAAGEGPQTPFFMSPLYQLFVGGSYALFPGTYWAVRVLQLLLGLGTLLLVYLTARRLLPRWWALGVLVAAALYHQLFFFETLLLPSTLSVFLVTLGVYLAVRQRQDPRLPRSALIGAVFALAALAHGTLALPAAALGLYLFFKRLKKNRRRALAELALLVGAAVVVVAPVTLVNSLAEGDFVLLSTNGGLNLYLGNQAGATGLYRPYDPTTYAMDFTARQPAERELGPDVTPGEVDDYWYGRFGELWRADPGRIVALSFKRALLYLNGYEFPQVENYYFEAESVPLLRLPWLSLYLLLPLGIAGLVFGRRRGARVLGVVALAYFLGLLPFFVTARFRVVVAPLLIIGAGLFVHRAVHWVRLLRRGGWKRSRRLRWGVILAAPLLVFLTWAALRAPREVHAYDNLAVGYNNLGSEAYARGAYAESVEYQRLALGESPGMAPARLNLVQALLALEDYDAALAELELLRGARLDPDRLASLTAQAQRGRGDDWAALGTLQEAASQPWTGAALRAELAALFLELGDTLNARKHAAAALERDPAEPAAHLVLARIALSADDRDRAVELLREGLEQARWTAALRYELALLENDLQGLWEAAVQGAAEGDWEVWSAALAELAARE